MNTALWIVAGLLAVAFLAVGAIKLTTPKEQLLPKMPWTADYSAGAVKAIGGIEVLGALGLILPAVLNIAPALVAWAALGLALTMSGAAIVHLRRGDGFAAAVPAIVLGLLAAFLAWARFGSHAF